MTRMIATVVVASLAFTMYGEPQQKKKKQPTGFEKVLRSMFPSATPKITKRATSKRKETKRKVEPTPAKTPATTSSPRVTVDAEWLARYWELEAAWGYYIPEDDEITFENGKYTVPSVVSRHYDALAKTPPRRDAAAGR